MNLPPNLTVALDVSTCMCVAEHLAERMSRPAVRYDDTTTRSPWLSAQELADYLRCPLSRVRKLSMTNAIPMHRDGGRVLFRRDEIDVWITTGGAA